MCSKITWGAAIHMSTPTGNSPAKGACDPDHTTHLIARTSHFLRRQDPAPPNALPRRSRGAPRPARSMACAGGRPSASARRVVPSSEAAATTGEISCQVLNRRNWITLSPGKERKRHNQWAVRATALTELAPAIDPGKLVLAAAVSPLAWSQRLGYLLDRLGGAGRTAPLADFVAVRARSAALLRRARKGAPSKRNAKWKLLVNADVDSDR